MRNDVFSCYLSKSKINVLFCIDLCYSFYYNSFVIINYFNGNCTPIIIFYDKMLMKVIQCYWTHFYKALSWIYQIINTDLFFSASSLIQLPASATFGRWIFWCMYAFKNALYLLIRFEVADYEHSEPKFNLIVFRNLLDEINAILIFHFDFVFQLLRFLCLEA